MSRVIVALISSLAVSGCASLPDGGMPDGTYRAAGGNGDAIVVDRREAVLYLPTLSAPRKTGPYGRAFSLIQHGGGELSLVGSSNDTYYLELTRLCDWRWNAPAIECHREGGAITRFVRDASGAAVEPALPWQQVWLAAARHVLANGKAGVSRPLAIHFRSSYPGWKGIAQLDKQTRSFCGLSREEANGVLRSLAWLNKGSRGIGDVFDHRPEFTIARGDPGKGDYLGLSDVMFGRDGETAYLNVDIGGRSGSIVRMKLASGAWTWVDECAVWTRD